MRKLLLLLVVCAGCHRTGTPTVIMINPNYYQDSAGTWYDVVTISNGKQFVEQQKKYHLWQQIDQN